MDQAEPETVYEDGNLLVTHIAGDTDAGIVSFTGVKLGHGGAGPTEFRKSLQDVSHNLWFVTDKTSHWYNENFEKAVDVVRSQLASRKLKQVTTIGNSMGGFGAVTFARHLPNCHQTIAFSAQSARDPSIVPWESRWRKRIADVARWNGLDAVATISDNVAYHLFYDPHAGLEKRHMNRFAELNRSNVHIHHVEGAAHRIARTLKQQHLLSPLLRGMIGETSFDVTGLLGGLGAAAPERRPVPDGKKIGMPKRMHAAIQDAILGPLNARGLGDAALAEEQTRAVMEAMRRLKRSVTR